MDRFDAFLTGESDTLLEEPLAKQASDPLDAFLNGDTDELPRVGNVTSAASSLARGVTSEGILMQGQGLANLGSQVVPAAGAVFTPEGDKLFGEIRALNRQIDLLDKAGMDAYDLREERSQKVKQWEALTAQNPRQAQLQGVARKLGTARETVREALPVDPEFQASLGGQVMQGFGQMIGSLPLYAIPYAGVAAGPLASMGQIYQEGYDEALALTGDEGKAHEAGLNNLPAAAFEVMGDRLVLGKALKAMKGKARIRDLATGVAATMASEGATEGMQTFWQNLNAKYLSRYDPDRLLDDEVIDSILVGALVGGGTTGAVSLPAAVSELRNQSREKTKGRRLKAENEKSQESTRPERPGEKAEGGRLKAERLEPITDDGLLKSLEQVLSEQGSERLRRKVEGDQDRGERLEVRGQENFEDAKPVKPDVETRANRLESRIEELRKSRDLPFERNLQRELERSEKELNAIRNPGAALQERLAVVRDGFQWPEGLDRPKDGLPLRRNKKKQRIRFADPLEEALYTIVKHPRKAGTARLKSRLTTGLGLSEEEVLFAGEQIRDAVFAQSDAQGDGRLFIEPTLLSSQNAGSRLADLTRRAASFQADPAAKEAALSALKENSEKLIGQEADRKARVKDEQARMRAIERTGIDPETGEIADITRISDQELDRQLEQEEDKDKAEALQAELERRIREAEQESAFEEREELGQVLPEIGLPTPKRAAGAGLSTEFAELQEFFNKGQGLRIFKSKNWEETDYLAAYRERGFNFDTLDDLIEAVKQTARGEKIYAAPGQDEIPFSKRQKDEGRRLKPDQTAQAETSRKAAEWQQNLERIAPGVMRDFRLQFGDPEQLVTAGIVRRENLTGEEEAAYLAAQKTFYLFDQALRRNPDDVTRLNALHEMGHAFWDRLTLDEKDRLRQIRKEEQASKSGPLFDPEGNPVKHLALGVWEDTPYGEAEWFAERMAHANDGWAKRRIDSQEQRAQSRAFFEQLAARFRAFLEQIRSLVERLPGVLPDEVRNFRKFLDQGERWTRRRQKTSGQNLSFARREENQDDAAEQFRRLEKRRNELHDAGNYKAARSLNAQVNELRQRMIQEQLDAAREQPADLPELDPQLLPKLQEQETATFKPESRLSKILDAILDPIKGLKSSTPEISVTKTENIYNTNLAGQDPRSKNPAWFEAGKRMFGAANDSVRREASKEITDILEPIQQIGKEKGISPNEAARYAELVQRRKKLRTAKKSIPENLTKEIEALANKLETVPYELFRKAIYYGDLFYRSKLTGKDGEPLQLPNGLTEEQVKQRLGDLYRKIGKSEHKDNILDSLQRHYTWVEQMQQDLEARGFVIPEELRNPLYFRHFVIDYTNGRLETVQATTENDFRAYLQELAGTAREIETDYLTAMYQHAVEVKAHNRRQDIVEEYFEPYNLADALQQQLEAEAEETGRKVGPNAWKYLPEDELPEGYVYYEPDSRLALRPEYIIDPGVLNRALGEHFSDPDLLTKLRGLGLDVTLSPDEIRQGLVPMAKTRWIIPEEIANALDAIVKRDTDQRSASRKKFYKLLNKSLNLWKRNILFNPVNWIRYEFNNLTTDLGKLIEVDPKVFSNIPSAVNEAIRFFEGKGEVSEDFKKAIELGVVDSVTAHEVDTLKELREFKDFLTSRKNFISGAKNFLAFTVRGSRIREGAFRYAKFKADLDRIRNGARPVYAGAYWKDVEALPDAYHKAELISKRTFGDYGDISVTGQYLARNLIPFYRWTEINFRYHVNLLRNMSDMTMGKLPKQRQAVIGILLRKALPFIAVYLWNNSDDREELEETLSAEDRRRFHIILGKDEEGRTMVVYAPTALGDVMRWFGGQAGMQLFGEYLRGDIDLSTMAGEYAKAASNSFVNSIFQSIRPEVKSAYEILSNKTIFPDVFDQRTIPDYDLKWNILNNMTDHFIGDIIRRTFDKEYYASKDSWDWASQIILQVRRRDPEAWSYYTLRDKVEDFLEEERGTSREYGSYNAPHSQVLRNFRRAINNADVQGALIFYDKLLEYGYTSEQLRGSILGQDPLSGLSKGDGLRQKFVSGLTPAEKQQLDAAYRYYARIAASKGKESILFPSDRASPSYRQSYQGRPDLLMDLIRKSETLTEAEADRAAELLLQQSLR